MTFAENSLKGIKIGDKICYYIARNLIGIAEAWLQAWLSSFLPRVNREAE